MARSKAVTTRKAGLTERTPLTEKQMDYVSRRALGETIRQIAEDMNVSPSMLRRWERLPNVAVRLETLIGDVESSRRFTQAESHDMLMDIHDDPEATPSVRLSTLRELNNLHKLTRPAGGPNVLFNIGQEDAEDAKIITETLEAQPVEKLRLIADS